MNNRGNREETVRFVPFEYHPATGELSRRGHKIKLVGQPVHLLNLLLQCPGRIVTREEMRAQLWPEGTFVDFEHSLNAAIKRLRRALGDTAAKPRFIETLSRRGYRFIAPVETAEVEAIGVQVASRNRTANQAPVLSGPKGWQMPLALAVVFAAVAGSFIILAVSSLRRRPDRMPQHGTKLTRLMAGDGDLSDPAISYDGKMLAYVSGQGGSARIYLRRVAGGDAIRLSHEDLREVEPTFAPDDERIAFVRYPSGSDRPQICIAPVFRGEVDCPLNNARDPAWSPDGSRLAFIVEQPGGGEALATSKINGTALRIILNANITYPFLRDPSWSADGRSVAVERSNGGVEGEIWIVPDEGGPASRLHAIRPDVFAHHPVFTPDGKGIIYSSSQAGATELWYYSLDKRRRAVQLTQGLSPEEWPSVSRTGRVVFSSVQSKDALFLTNLHSGVTRRLLNHSPHLWAPFISPDGREIAFSQAENDGGSRIWALELGGGKPRPLTSGDAPQVYGRYSRDGRWLIYFTSVPGASRIWRIPRGGGVAEPLTPAKENAAYGDLSPDGRTLAYARTDNGISRIYLKKMTDGAERQLVRSASTEPRWSPHGNWIAFSPDHSLKRGVFVIRPDGRAMSRLTSSGGFPAWLPDGKRIAFRKLNPDGTQQIETVTLDGKVAQLKRLHFSGDNEPFNFSLDGQFIAYINSEKFSSEIWLVDLPR